MAPSKNPPARKVLAAKLQLLTAGESQREVARKTGLGEGTVARARSGRGNTTLNNVDKLAKAYGLNAYQLIMLDPTARFVLNRPKRARRK